MWEGAGDKGGSVSLGRNGRGEREKHSSLALPLASGTFLSTESWEGWRSRKGVLGALGEVGVQPQRRADANKPEPRMPSPGSLGDSRTRSCG